MITLLIPHLLGEGWRDTGWRSSVAKIPPWGTLAFPSMSLVPGLGGTLMGTTCPAPLRASCLVVPNALGLPKHRFLAPKAVIGVAVRGHGFARAVPHRVSTARAVEAAEPGPPRRSFK